MELPANPEAIQKLSLALLSPTSCVTTTMLATIEIFGTECLDWEPQTFVMEFGDLFHKSPPRYLLDRVQTGAVLFTTDQLYQTMESFNSIALVMNHEGPSFLNFEPVDAAEAAWCVSEAALLLGEDYDPKQFTPEVATYVGVLLSQDGFLRPPPMLKFAIMPDMSISGEPDTELLMSRERQNSQSMADLESFIRARYINLVDQLEAVPVSHPEAGWTTLLQRLRSRVLGLRESAPEPSGASV